MEEVMGPNGVSAVLNASGLTRFVKNYPPNDLTPCVPFEDYATFVKAVEDFYGAREARASLIRVGRATFQYAMKEHPTTLGLAGLALKVLPLNMQMKTVLSNIAAGDLGDDNLKLLESAVRDYQPRFSELQQLDFRFQQRIHVLARFRAACEFLLQVRVVAELLLVKRWRYYSLSSQVGVVVVAWNRDDNNSFFLEFFRDFFPR
jgi:hypothetical protein